MFIYPIYYHNWRNISTIYIYNKANIKRNILTIKQNTSEVGRAKDLLAPLYLGGSAELKKRLLPPPCLSVRMEILGSYSTDFFFNLIFEYFSKICRENSGSIEIWQEWRVLYLKTKVGFWSYFAWFFLEWEMFQTNVVEKIKTHVLRSFAFCSKSCRLWENVEKYFIAGQTKDDDMIHSHCMLDT